MNDAANALLLSVASGSLRSASLPRRNALWTAALVVALGACAAPPEASSELAIIGGQVDLEDPAVVFVETLDGACTGTLVGKTSVLTAAHCVTLTADLQNPAGRVSFGPGAGDFFAARDIAEVFVQRRYASGRFYDHDLALVRLAAAAPPEVAPLATNSAKLAASFAGTELRAVGFGADDGVKQTGLGIKRTVDLAVTDIDDVAIFAGDATRNTCQGDSGGPLLLATGGVDRIVAVTSVGAVGCGEPGRKTRVDVFAGDFLREVLAAWDGPCPRDDQCVTGQSCPEFGDPDCDPCGFDGTCASGCATRDLDCPLGGVAGDACTGDSQCESRQCTGNVCRDPCGDGELPCPRGFACSRDGTCREAAGQSGGCSASSATGGATGAISAWPGWAIAILLLRLRRSA